MLLDWLKRNKNWLGYIFLGLFCVLMFGWWQLSTNFPDPDAFYHMKMGQLLFDQGVVKDFTWQQYTVLKDYYIDHHLLYHIFMIPFVVIGNALVGAKIFVVLGITAFILCLVYVLRKLNLRGAFLIGLVIALSAPFTFRLNLVKANSLSLIILFLGLYLAYRRRYIWLAVLSFFYVWAYGGFALMILVVGLIAVIDLVQNKKFKRNLILIASNVAGILLGLVINPYFPKNLSFYWQQVVQIGIINYQDKIGVGGEWYPYGIVELLTGCSFLTVLAFLAIILFAVFIKKQNDLSWLGLGVFILGLALVLKSRRYIEYYVPLTAFFVITVFNASFKEWTIKKVWPYFKSFWQKNFINKFIVFVFLVYFCLVIPAIAVKDFTINNKDLREGISYYKFEAASTWLQQNSEPGDIVLHSDWDDWPVLFYHNSHNYYIVGLDPTFMYNYDQDLYWKWVNITIGKQKDDLPQIIGDEFKASYVMVEKDHGGMDRNISKFEEFGVVYEDAEVKIYKLKK